MKLALWKPRNDGKGNAVIFELNDKGGWLTFLPQNGPKSFDFSKRGNAKLGLGDAAEFLAVLSGRKEGMGQLKDERWGGVFHRFGDSGSSVISLSKGQYGYQLGLSIDRGGNKSRYSIGVTDGELELIRVFMEELARAGMFELSKQREVEPDKEAIAEDDRPF